MQIRLLDLSFSSPAENLACDEALLDELEAGSGPPTLRFWESSTPFVALGYANSVATEVNRAACEQLGIPILRRCSGGGTVVQGPGCLNYNLTLPIASETAGITETNCFVMSRHRDAMTRLLGKETRIQGHTDLTLDGVKFSGNAQRRKKNALVFHGCFLLEIDLALIERVLLHPTREPDYRAGRQHSRFITNLHVSTDAIKEALTSAWEAWASAAPPNRNRIDALVKERYTNPAWNSKF